MRLWSALVTFYYRYQKKLPHNYEKAEKELEKDQAKVDQYIAGRSISPVRLILFSPRSCFSFPFGHVLWEGPSQIKIPLVCRLAFCRCNTKNRSLLESFHIYHAM